ncbi:MAG TPA: tetratricopeptide repeat protein [Kofleriaceae bacterium]|jgi:tetratricopeptide (TPR) repeat protein
MTRARRGPRRLAASLVIAGVSVALSAAPAAHADTADTADEHLARGRELYDRGEFAAARDELLAAYRIEPRPELLFALGQVELNTGQFAQAIDYYERFIATEPGADQIALAQQAIGAARARIAEKPAAAPPPRPPPHRQWDTPDTGLAAVGGATIAIGGGLVIYGLDLAGDHGGTLSAYNDRVSRATVAQWAGAGCLAAGALAIGGALLRWRLHLVDSEIQPVASPKAAGVAWVGQW